MAPAQGMVCDSDVVNYKPQESETHMAVGRVISTPESGINVSQSNPPCRQPEQSHHDHGYCISLWQMGKDRLVAAGESSLKLLVDTVRSPEVQALRSGTCPSSDLCPACDLLLVPGFPLCPCESRIHLRNHKLSHSRLKPQHVGNSASQPIGRILPAQVRNE